MLIMAHTAKEREREKKDGRERSKEEWEGRRERSREEGEREVPGRRE